MSLRAQVDRSSRPWMRRSLLKLLRPWRTRSRRRVTVQRQGAAIVWGEPFRGTIGCSRAHLVSPSSHRQAPVPSWKVLLGALSLLLAALIWTSGLVNSLSRPSVAPSLNLQQQEVQLLAEPALPHAIGSALLGARTRAPCCWLSGANPATDRSPRQTQLLALLQNEVDSVPEIAQLMILC
ncbi:MAG: hypothetical protein CM15mP77_3100 [Synechococcus sp.]|nr:MAG: hypothetical protein CM15mP77_3100 [Synechococcus sp.]